MNSRLSTETSSQISTMAQATAHVTKVDGRKNNRGQGIRKQYTVNYKVKFLEEVNEHIDNGVVPNAIVYFKRKDLSLKNLERYVNQYTKWSKDSEKLTMAALQGVKTIRKGLSPFHKLEHCLYQLI